VSAPALAAALAFAALGIAAERAASFWPAEEASRRGPGLRTVLLAVGAGLSAWAIVLRSAQPWWATLAYLFFLALLVVLSATDLDQRRLPHIVLDPLIVGAVVFIPFNPAVEPLNGIAGALLAVVFMGVLGLVIRSGVATGDLYLVAPLGLLLGWEGVFVAIFVAALLSAVTSIILLATRRVGLRSYIPFGPFLVAGTVITLVRDDHILATAFSISAALLGVALGGTIPG
jgi:leader peptidase (prepilin peptidase)/N-methyltransferase